MIIEGRFRSSLRGHGDSFDFDYNLNKENWVQPMTWYKIIDTEGRIINFWVAYDYYNL